MAQHGGLLLLGRQLSNQSVDESGGRAMVVPPGLTEGCAAANSNEVGVAALRPELCFQLPAQLPAADLLVLLLCHLQTPHPN